MSPAYSFLEGDVSRITTTPHTIETMVVERVTERIKLQEKLEA
jgi:hypothetical protein